MSHTPENGSAGVARAPGRRDLPMLVLLLLATQGFFALWRVVLHTGWEVLHLLGMPGLPMAAETGSRDVLVVVLVTLLAVAAWLFFVVRWGVNRFDGPRARRYRTAALVLIGAGCVWFVWTLYYFMTLALQPAERLGP